MGPQEPSPDPLAAAVLPVLLHRIRNTTQLISSLNAVLSMDASGHAPGAQTHGEPLDRGGHMAAAASEADELGWLLGVLASGLGADLLLRRCEPRGLGLALALVQEALRRDGRELTLPKELPLLTSEAPCHGELCWVVANLAWDAGTSAETPTALTLENVAGTWELGLPAGPGPDARALRVEERLPGAEFHCRNGGGGEGRLTLPGPWMR